MFLHINYFLCRLQVLSNAGIASLLVILFWAMTGSEDKCLDSTKSKFATALIGGIIGHYSCSNGDTWSSELGILSDAQPRLITTFKVVFQISYYLIYIFPFPRIKFQEELSVPCFTTVYRWSTASLLDRLAFFRLYFFFCLFFLSSDWRYKWLLRSTLSYKAFSCNYYFKNVQLSDF